MSNSKMSRIAAVTRLRKDPSPARQSSQLMDERRTTDLSIHETVKAEVDSFYSQLGNLHNQWTERLADVEKKLANAEHQLEEARSEKQALTDQLRRQEEESQHVGKELTEWRKREAQLCASIEELTSKVNSLQTDRNSYSDILGSYQNQVGRLETRLLSLDTEFTLVKATNSSMKEELVLQTRQLEAKEREVALSNSKLNELRLAYEKLTKEKSLCAEDASNELKKCWVSLEDCKLNIHAMKEEKAEIMAIHAKEIGEKDNEASRLRSRVKELQDSLNVNVEEVAKLHKAQTDTARLVSHLEVLSTTQRETLDAQANRIAELDRLLAHERDLKILDENAISESKAILQAKIDALERQVKEKVDLLKDSEVQWAAQRDSISTAESRCATELAELSRKYLILQAALSESTSEKDAAIREYRVLKEESSAVNAQASELRERMLRLTSERDSLVEKLRESASEMQREAERSSLLTKNLNAAQSKVEQLTSELNILREAMTAKEDISKELEKRILRMDEELSTSRNLSGAVANAKSSEAIYQRELEDCRHLLHSKTEEAAQLEAELQTVRVSLSTLRGESSALQAKVALLEHALAEATNAEKTMRDELTKASKQLRQFTDSKTELIERIKAEADAAREVAKAKEDEVAKLVAEMELLRSDTSSFAEEIEALEQELEQRLSEMTEMGEVEQSLRKENGHLREVIEAKDRSVESSERQLAALQQTNNERSAEVSLLRNNLSISLADLEATTKELHNVKKGNEELKVNIQTLEVYLQEMEDLHARDEGETEALSKELSSLKSELSSRQLHSREVITRMEVEKASLEESVSRMGTRLQDLTRAKALEEDKYKKELSAFQRILTEKEGEIALLRQQEEGFRSEIERAGEVRVRALCEAEQRVGAERQMAIEERVRAESLEQRTEQLSQQLSQTSQENRKLKGELSDLTRRHKEMEEVVRASNEQKELVMTQWKQCFSDLGLTKAEIGSLKMQLSDRFGDIEALKEELRVGSEEKSRSANEIETLQAILVSRSKEVERLGNEVTALTRQVREGGSGNERLSNEVLGLKQLLRNKGLALDASQQENQQLRVQLAELCDREEAQMSRLRRELSDSHKVKTLDCFDY